MGVLSLPCLPAPPTEHTGVVLAEVGHRDPTASSALVQQRYPTNICRVNITSNLVVAMDYRAKIQKKLYWNNVLDLSFFFIYF